MAAFLDAREHGLLAAGEAVLRVDNRRTRTQRITRSTHNESMDANHGNVGCNDPQPVAPG